MFHVCGQLRFAIIVAWALLLAAAVLSPFSLQNADAAELVTRQTARVAVIFWGLAAAFILLNGREARLVWTLACAAYLIHVATAFDRVHHWCHEAAFEHVATASGFGPGIFVSYAFSALWVLEVGWWWLAPDAYAARSKWLDRGIHGFMAFVVFNGTVVYETGLIRWVGLLIFIMLGGLMLRRHWRKSPASTVVAAR